MGRLEKGAVIRPPKAALRQHLAQREDLVIRRRFAVDDEEVVRVTEFGHDLPADAAGRTVLLQRLAFRAADDGDGGEILLALAHSLEKRGALGAVGGTEAAVFDVAAGVDPALLRQKRRADGPVGIRAVGKFTRLDRTPDEQFGLFLRDGQCHFYLLLSNMGRTTAARQAAAAGQTNRTAFRPAAG